MYPTLFYCVDFIVLNFLLRKGPVSGFYMIPLGLPYGTRDQRSAILTVHITPSGISNSHVLDYLVPDILEGAIDGFIRKDGNVSFIRRNVYLWTFAVFWVTLLLHFK